VKPDTVPESQVELVSYPAKPYQIFVLAHWIAQCLTYRQPTLLWITEWDIWPSSENWHVYYTIRRSQGDLRLLNEAPGHFFLGHESEEMATFLQIAMLNGWGGYILTEANYVNAFFSHDEFIKFFADIEENLSEVRETAKLRFSK